MSDSTGETQGRPDLSVVIPALHEAENLSHLLPELREALGALGIRAEIIVVDRAPDEATRRLAEEHRAILLDQEQPGYGRALQRGFAEARGAFVMTMDGDLSHPAAFVSSLWRRRAEAGVVIASRYVPGAAYRMPATRALLSRVLNAFFSRGLDLRVRDMSSGYRLYGARVLRSFALTRDDFSVLQEILVQACCEGWTILEEPFEYRPRRHGSSHARILAFGLSYLQTFWALYRLRNSIQSADYDARAYDSAIPVQRWWQRRRFREVTALVAGEGPVLDVGCGSSRILSALPAGSVGVDVLLRKLRRARPFGTALAQASGTGLPFADASFRCVLCSQVIEHLPKEAPILAELARVLAPGGALVLGTPDYARWEWRVTEALYERVLPSAYADEHISHYTGEELRARFAALGFTLEATRYIARGELVLKLRKGRGR